jgi:hypothetical protein
MKAFFKICILFLFVFSKTNALFAQTLHNKGTFYLYWGWNQAQYSKSDIHFTGNNYDFTLKKVIARERQTPFNLKIYLNPTQLTIPQVNYRMGYFVSDHYDISFGVDHMKYVMKRGQTVAIQGSLKNTGTKYDGVYNGENIVLSPDFLTYEHTDGLNYINLEVNRHDKIADLSKYNIKNVHISLTEGISVGGLYPRTDIKLLVNKENDEFHWAGYGIAAKVGLNIAFLKYLFFQTELKGGFINMPDIRTTNSEADRAKQHFFFMQANVLFGFRIHL